MHDASLTFLNIDSFDQPTSQMYRKVNLLPEDAKFLLPRSCSCLLLHGCSFLLLPPGTQTSKSDDDQRKEQENESSAQAPHCFPKVRPAPRPVVIDVVAQDSEQAEVSGHYDQAQYPGHKCGQDTEERSDRAGTDGHDPGDESYAAGDGVQDHGSGEAVGGAGFDVRELRVVKNGDNVGKFVADVAA